MAGSTTAGTEEGGLLGLALSPSYRSDHLVYAYVTTASDNRIVRMTYDPSRPAKRQLGTAQTVLRGIPEGVIHDGGRIAFGRCSSGPAGAGCAAPGACFGL